MLETLTPPPFSTMHLIFWIEHLLCATCFLPRELAVCGCGWPSCHSTPSYGPSGLPPPQRNIGSRSCREGSGRCSSRQARRPGRRPGDLGTWGPRPRGATAVFVAPRDCAPAGQTRRRAERRGSEGRGARGGPEEGRWHRLLRLRAPRKSRSESCERLAEARSAQSGSEVRSLGPRSRRRRPLPTRVQPGSPRRRAGRRWSSLELRAGGRGRRPRAERGPEPSQPRRSPPPASPSPEAPSVPRSLLGAPRRANWPKIKTPGASPSGAAAAAAGPGAGGPWGGWRGGPGSR